MQTEQESASMQVKDIMTREVITVSVESPITEVADILFKKRIHGVPVVDGKKITGIITETDFFTKSASSIYLPSYIHFLKENRMYEKLSTEKQAEVDKLLNARAEDIMTKECVTIFQEMQVKDLLEFFRTTKFMTLPVTDENNNLVGIVTLSDIIGLLKA
jgi:CBS domain-containing protein